GGGDGSFGVVAAEGGVEDALAEVEREGAHERGVGVAPTYIIQNPALSEEAGDEPFQFTVADLSGSDLSTLPEDITLWVMDNEFPDTLISRDNDRLACEITEHIYSKFWWHKFSARAFADAMERAVIRLKHEGHPLDVPTIDSDNDIHIWVRWHLVLPAATSGTKTADSIRAAFDLVWHRADSILENSDSVLILGKDQGPALDRLKQIGERLQERGYFTYIIKGQPDRSGEGVVQKVLRYALSSKFVVIENTEPSGHLYELPHVTKLAECVTVILQEEGKGATWMFEDAYAKHAHWHKVTYDPTKLPEAVDGAAAWAEEFVKGYTQYQIDHLPWLST
ncbi:MAG: hypothetical protein ABJF88_07260, partial [Rhodothermales bacterium]